MDSIKCLVKLFKKTIRMSRIKRIKTMSCRLIFSDRGGLIPVYDALKIVRVQKEKGLFSGNPHQTVESYSGL
jgi:hypothetical protein